MPSVGETAVALYGIIVSGSFLTFILTAFSRVISGLILGIIIGVLVAAICYKFDLVKTIVSPIISIMKATPVACIIVLLWIRFNYTEIAVLVVLLMVTPIVWQNVYDGLKSTDPSMIEVAYVFELSTWEKIKVLFFPSTLTYLLPAVITSVGMAWKAEIAAEIMTYSNIGELIRDFKTVTFDTASIFAWTIIIVGFSILFEIGTKYLLRRLGNALKAE
jgi:NitT/TauT family transport system permease protein